MRQAKRWNRGVVLGVVLGLLLAAAPAWAEKPAAPAAGEKPAGKASSASAGLKGEWATVNKQAALSPEQQTQLNDALQAKAAALEEWEKAHGQKLADLRAKAKEATDRSEAAKLRSEAAELSKQKRAIDDKHDGQIMAVLNKEQQGVLHGLRLYKAMMARYKKVAPSAEQQEQIRAMCNEAGKQAPQLTSTDQKSMAAFRNDLAKDIEQKVLTDEQRQALAQPKAKPEAKAAETE